MIPAEHKSSVISAGMHFMRAITEAYGAEEGMRLWDSIASALDPDVKGEIFFAMITGEYNDRIHIKAIGHDRIATIKAFRNYDKRRLGLKEAKDLSDLCQMGKVITLEIEPRNRVQIQKELMAIGCQLA